MSAPPEFDHGRANYNHTLARAAQIARKHAATATTDHTEGDAL